MLWFSVIENMMMMMIIKFYSACDLTIPSSETLEQQLLCKRTDMCEREMQANLETLP